MDKAAEKIHIVFASDSNYAQHAAVAMTSILTNMEAPERAAFYLLDDEVEPAVRRKMQGTVEHFGSELSFIPVDASAFSELFVSGQLSRTAYFRLEMGTLLPETVQKAIYLDCDLLVKEDIQKLWNHDMQGHPLAAVPDLGIMASSKDWKKKQRELGLKQEDLYFNSGVLMVDLKQWREQDYGRRVEQLAHDNAYQHHDQDALNKAFYGNWQPLPLRWNVIPPVWNMFAKILLRTRFRKAALEARRDIAILHYAGGYKPWEYEIHPGFNEYYYELLERTEFRDAVMPRPDKRRKGRSIRRQMLRLKAADCWQRLLS